ncbi:MAG: hypothetical protein AB1511_12830 [Deinococcota bacterium]
MTDLLPPAAEVAAATLPKQQKKRRKYPIHFHASLRWDSPIRVVPSGVELHLGGTSITVGVTEQVRRTLQEQPPELGRPSTVLLWFRTPEGYVQELELAKVMTATGPEAASKPQFSVGGRLKAVNREEGFLIVEVEPNKQGVLAEAFPVHIWAALDLLEKLPKVGRTLVVTGEYRPQSGRLVATRCTPVHIGAPKSPPVASPQAVPQG